MGPLSSCSPKCAGTSFTVGKIGGDSSRRGVARGHRVSLSYVLSDTSHMGNKTLRTRASAVGSPDSNSSKNGCHSIGDKNGLIEV